jgi:hypothetical protein
MGNIKSQKLTPAQKQTKLRSGIQPIQIMIFTNYLAKPQFPLTSDLFEFPQLSNKPSGLEKYPLISTNVKYNASIMRYLTHPQRVQVFFSFSNLMQFISKRTIRDESEKNDILKHNTRFMLEMLFPISYPIVKTLKTASDPDNMMSFFVAAEKEFVYQKFNTYLKLDGKMCTVDEIRFADTFSANPIYVKLYDLAKDFLVKRDAAVMVLHRDTKTRLSEFERALNAKKSDILTKITDEIMKIYNSNSKIDVAKLSKDKADCDAALKDIKTKRTALEELEVEQKELLRYNRKDTTGYVSVKNTTESHLKNHYKRIFPSSREPLINVDTTLAESQKTIKTLEITIKELEKEKSAPATGKGKKTVTVNIDDIDLLIDGYTKLIEYINKLIVVRDAYKIGATSSINVLFGKIDRLTDLQKEITKLQYEEKEKSDDCDKIKKQIDSGKPVDLTFISATLPTQKDVETALGSATNDATFKGFGINTLIQDYVLIKRTLMDVIYTTIKTSVTAFDTEIADAATDERSVDTTVLLSDIKTTKDAIKSVYESDVNYFSQRNPLAEAFMKLRKICGFAYLITTMHQQQENMNIEREYNINYNIDADLKKGEYLFHKKMTEDLRAYYYPNRQSMEPDIKAIVSVSDADEINMDAIVTMFEDEPKTSAAIDLIDLQGKPRYECQVRMVVVGGAITEENSEKIDCSYQNLILGADILKEYFNLIVPQFTDLTQEIAEAEKKYSIKYEKIKLEETGAPNVGPMPALPALPAAPAGMPAMPAMPPAPPKKTSTVVVTDADLVSIINKNIPTVTSGPPPPSATQLKDIIKTKGYENVKVFLETAVDYSEKSKPDPYGKVNSTTTYKKDYADKNSDAETTIDLMIRKKDNELKENKTTPTLNAAQVMSLEREINSLQTLKKVIAKVDKYMEDNWLPRVTGGKKTRKRRRHRIKRNTRRLR